MSNALHTTSCSTRRSTRIARARKVRRHLKTARSTGTRFVCNSTSAAVAISAKPNTVVTSTTLFLAANLALQLATAMPLAHMAALLIGVAMLKASPSRIGSAVS